MKIFITEEKITKLGENFKLIGFSSDKAISKINNAKTVYTDSEGNVIKNLSHFYIEVRKGATEVPEVIIMIEMGEDDKKTEWLIKATNFSVAKFTNCHTKIKKY